MDGMTIRPWNPASEPNLPAETSVPTCWVVDNAAIHDDHVLPDHHTFCVVFGRDDALCGPFEDIIPALLIRQQSDLANVPALLAVQAKRRALVVECGGQFDWSCVAIPEPTDYEWDEVNAQDWECTLCGGEGFREYNDAPEEWGEDCPSEPNHLIPCRECAEIERDRKLAAHKLVIDRLGLFVILVAPPVAWDVQTALAIAKQCRAAGVPCVACGEVGAAYQRLAYETDQGSVGWYDKPVRDWPAEIPRTLPDWSTT